MRNSVLGRGNPLASGRRCIRPSGVALPATDLRVCLGRASCWGGASAPSIRDRICATEYLESTLSSARTGETFRAVQSIVVVTMLLATLGLVSACATAPPGPPPAATLFAYWDADPPSSVCPAGEECTKIFSSLKKLRHRVKKQRKHDLQIVDFDAAPTSETTSEYVGVWARSSARHRFDPDLSWNRFRKKHSKLSRKGYHLVSLTVYSSHLGGQRVAGIWARDRRGGWPRGHKTAWTPDEVDYDLDLKTLQEGKLSKKGRYLAQIEVYPRPNRPDDQLVAAVWRKGSRTTRILPGLPCDLHSQTLSVNDSDGTESRFLRCQLTLALETLNAQGLRPVDLEPYEVSGEVRWAALLEKHNGPDWLQIDTSPHFIDLRNTALNDPSDKNGGQAPQPMRFGLRDVDIFFIPFGSTHEGVAHDGGTSGPPPGG